MGWEREVERRLRIRVSYRGGYLVKRGVVVGHNRGCMGGMSWGRRGLVRCLGWRFLGATSWMRNEDVEEFEQDSRVISFLETKHEEWE
jgi:hypothetical protein